MKKFFLVFLMLLLLFATGCKQSDAVDSDSYTKLVPFGEGFRIANTSNHTIYLSATVEECQHDDGTHQLAKSAYGCHLNPGESALFEPETSKCKNINILEYSAKVIANNYNLGGLTLVVLIVFMVMFFRKPKLFVLVPFFTVLIVIVIAFIHSYVIPGPETYEFFGFVF